MKYPHFFRVISRISRTFDVNIPRTLQVVSRTFVIVAILSSVGFIWYSSELQSGFNEGLGAKVEKQETMDVQVESVDAWQEIERTLSILEQRPDYAAAWLRLAVLYEQVGELELAREARDYTNRLNPDLQF